MKLQNQKDTAPEKGFSEKAEELKKEIVKLNATMASQENAINELQKKEIWLNYIFDHAPINIYVKDDHGRFLVVNRQFEISFGITEKELKDKTNVLYLDPTVRNFANAHDAKVLKTGQSSAQEETIGNRVYEVIKHPIFDDNGNPVEIIGFDIDITDLQKAHKELEKKNKELEAYVSIVSHDLKAPLRRIRQFSDILMNDTNLELGETALDYLGYISNSVIHLTALIDDLLMFSRLGKGEIEFHRVDLMELFLKVKMDLIDYKNTREEVIHLDGKLPVIEGQQLILEQIFKNLLDNAMKFIPTGKIPQVVVSAKEKRSHLIISIQDNGIGIDSKNHEAIFGVFKRLHTQEVYPGTGVGLAIVEKGVTIHNGRIWVESKAGEGSTFFVQLPYKANLITNK